MNTQTLSTMISQNIALADSGLLELKQLVDNGETIAANQHKYLVRKLDALKEREVAVTAGTDNISEQVAAKPELRANAPAIEPPVNKAPAPVARTPKRVASKIPASIVHKRVVSKAVASKR